MTNINLHYTMKYHRIPFIKLFSLVLPCLMVLITISACQVDTLPGIPTSTPSITLPPTNTITPTARPTATATPVAFALAGTPIASGQVITSQNANRLIQFARWGKGIPTGMEISLDGKFIAVTSTSGLHLFNATTLQSLRTLAPGSLLRNAAFSSDSAHLAVSSQSGQIIIFSLEDLSIQSQFTSRDSPILTMAFSHNGSYLAMATAQRQLIIYSLDSGEEVRTITMPVSVVGEIVFSADDEAVYCWQGKKTFASYSVKDGKRVQEVNVPNNSLGDSAEGGVFAPDGSLAAANTASQIRIYNAERGITLHLLDEVEEQISWLVIAGDGSTLSAVDGNTLRTWNLQSGEMQHERPLPANLSNIRQVQLTADGAYLAVNTDRLYLIDVADPEADITADYTNFSTDLRLQTRFNPANATWVQWFFDGSVRNFSATDGSLVSQSRLVEEILTSIASSADQAIQAVNFENPLIRLYGSDSKEPLSEFEMPSDVRSLALNNSGSVLAASDNESHLMIWMTSDSSLTAEVTLSSPARQLLFTNSGDRLFAQTIDRLLVLDSSTLQTEHQFLGYASALSPDGEIVAVTGGKDHYGTSIYNTETGKLLNTLPDQGIYMAVSAENNLLVVSGDVIRLWDINNGRFLAGLDTGGAGFGQVIFSPETDMLVFSPWDGGLLFWGVP